MYRLCKIGKNKKAPKLGALMVSGCGSQTRTDDLWVMSPTSYQLLHPASMNTDKLSVPHVVSGFYCNTIESLCQLRRYLVENNGFALENQYFLLGMFLNRFG